MGQNITLMGASYTGVEQVALPKTGSGTASFADPSGVTAVASDVASGKYFLTAAGVLTQGTNSGGGGGGDSTVVRGTLKGTTANSRLTITIPYSGSGYPIAFTIFPSEGTYNDVSGTFYSLVNRYGIQVFTIVKSELTVAPTYATSGNQNYGTVFCRYKSSSSNATSYSQSYSNTVNTFSSSSAATSSATQCIRFTANKTLSVYVIGNTGTNYGVIKDIEYTYVVLYSS